jgi:hypothetical protein
MARPALIQALRDRLTRAAILEQSDQHLAAFALLEEAHVLSQRLTLWHCRVHWRMWHNGWARRDWREVIGQTLRLPAAALFSKIWVPIGNTGGANVSAMRPMPIFDALKALLDN